MYVANRAQSGWVFIPRDDALFPCHEQLQRMELAASGAFHILHLCDANDAPELRAVANLGKQDAARDRMALDTIGARDHSDPPGSPWVIYAEPAQESRFSPHEIAGMVYTYLTSRTPSPKTH